MTESAVSCTYEAWKNILSEKNSRFILKLAHGQDTKFVLFNLLKCICDAFLQSPPANTDRQSGDSQTTTEAVSVDKSKLTVTPPHPNSRLSSSHAAHRLVVIYLNALVYLSKRVCLWLDHHVDPTSANLVRTTILSVLRVALWSYNRSVRCAALRCIRYYLHTSADARLFLNLKLDYLVARCFDLSYVAESSPKQPFSRRFPQINRNANARPGIYTREGNNPAPARPLSNRPGSQLNETSRIHRVGKRFSTVVTNLDERRHSVRLVYHLVRIAPRQFPTSLLQALSAPCLRALVRLRTASPCGGPCNEEQNKVRLAYRYRQAGLMPWNVVDDNSTEGTQMINDIAIRSCLLIIAELVIRAPAHAQFLMNPHSTSDGSSNVFSQVLLQTLLSTFASVPSQPTIHPAQVHEAVLLILLRFLDTPCSSHELLKSSLSSFLVPFTSNLYRSCQTPELSYHSYPSFVGCAKLCLITMLRSWPGVFHFLRCGFPCLRTLMYSLAVGATDVRNRILDLLYCLFPELPRLHPSITHIELAVRGIVESLACRAPSTVPVHFASPSVVDGSSSRILLNAYSPLSRRQPAPSAWDITGGFVPMEGCRVFTKHVVESTHSTSVADCHSALLLATLIEAGLYQGLVRAVADSNQSTSAQAGLLLGFLGYKASILFPPTHPLSNRFQQTTLLSSEVPGGQLSVVWLERLQRVMREHDERLQNPHCLIRVPLHSPFLECLARQSPRRTSSSEATISTSNSTVVGGSLMSQKMQLVDNWLDDLIPQSGVVHQSSTKPSSSHHGCPPNTTTTTDQVTPVDQWDWGVLVSLGRHLFDYPTMIVWETRARIQFLHQLMHFITPPTAEAGASPARTMRSCSIPNRPPTCPPTDPSPKRNPKSFNTISRGPVSFHIPVLDADTHMVNDALSPHVLVQMPHTWPHAGAAAILVAGLVPHLAIYPTDSVPGQLLMKFLSVVNDLFSDFSSTLSDHPGKTSESIFSAKKLSTTCSSLILPALGRLAQIEVGEARLQASHIFASAHKLFAHVQDDSVMADTMHSNSPYLLIKALIVSLDFSRANRLGTQLLACAINSSSKVLRLYVVQALRLFYRLRLPFFASWGTDALVKLCIDTSRRVCYQSLCLLEEVCLDPVNVQSLINHIIRTGGHNSTAKSPGMVGLLSAFGARLLDVQHGGPVAHRVFARLLSRVRLFELLATGNSSDTDNNSDVPALQSVRSSADLSSVRTPIHWVLDIAREKYNLVYASEMDMLMNKMWLGPVKQSEVKKRFAISSLSSRSHSFSNLLRLEIAQHRLDEADSDESTDSLRFSMDDYSHIAGLISEDDSGQLPPALTHPDPSSSSSIHTPEARSLHSVLPIHSYASLAEHPAGLGILISGGHLQAAVNILKLASEQHLDRSSSHSALRMTDDSSSIPVLEVKSALWALAHLGTSTCGYIWLSKQPDVVDLYSMFALHAKSIGLRVTAWLCINLIASTPGGLTLINSAPYASLCAISSDQPLWVCGSSSTMVGRSSSPTLVEPSIFSVTPTKLPDMAERETSKTDDLGQKSRLGNSNADKKKSRSSHGHSFPHSRRWFSCKLSPRRSLGVLSSEKSGMISDSTRNTQEASQSVRKIFDIFVEDEQMKPTTDTSVASASFEQVEPFKLRRGVRHESLSRDFTQPTLSSTTWTHRDLLPSHHPVWRSSSIYSLAKPNSRRESTEHSTQPTPRNPQFVCLPSDVRLLSTHLTADKVEVVDSSAAAQSPSSPTMLPTRPSLLSFIRVASSAQLLLSKYQEVCESGDMNDQSCYTPTESRLTDRDQIPQASEDGLNDVRSRVRFRLDSLSENNPSHPSSLAGIHPHSVDDCLLPLSCHQRDEFAALYSPSTVWFNQLFDVITGFLANVVSTSLQQALTRLVQIAYRQHSEGPNQLSSFDACVYSELSRLLASYTFPLQARVRIQSILVGLELPDLLRDVQDQVTNLEMHFFKLSNGPRTTKPH